MSTTTAQTLGALERTGDWTRQHPMIATALVVIAAVLAAALIGTLIGMPVKDQPVAQQHHVGGRHARVAAVHHHVATDAARSAAAPGQTTSTVAVRRTREIKGFPGRSLGAGHVSGAALLRQTASN
jgi:hypothetical protein